MVTWHMPILQKSGHLAVGTALPTSYPTASDREATYGNYGNHYQLVRRSELGMDSRNEMCRVNEKGDL